MSTRTRWISIVVIVAIGGGALAVLELMGPRRTVLDSLVPGAVERRLYVADDSEVFVYDIDDGHRRLHEFDVDDCDSMKGIAVSLEHQALYLTSADSNDLVCIDLATERVRWRRNYGEYPDSVNITADGKTLLVPCRDEKSWPWFAVDAGTGEPLKEIRTEKGKKYPKRAVGPKWTRSKGPHNTLRSADGSHFYLESITVPNITVVDVATMEKIGVIGPFSSGVRPFVIDHDEELAFANVDGLLGFEIASFTAADPIDSEIIHRVEAKTPPARLNALPPPDELPHNTPSHGLALSRDGTELWMADGYYGLLYVYDLTATPPRFVDSIPLYEDDDDRPEPTWITFSLEGDYAYAGSGQVVDTKTRRIVAHVVDSNLTLEVVFVDGRATRAAQR